MKISSRKLGVAFAIGLGLLPFLGVGHVFWKTHRDKRDAGRMIARKATLIELIDRFGRPMKSHAGLGELPERFRPLVSGRVSTNSLFYYYGREGLPSYWSFLIVPDPDGRIIDWGCVNSKP